MRPRSEIEAEVSTTDWKMRELTLEVLLDIRDGVEDIRNYTIESESRLEEIRDQRR